jgi:serine protease Do
MKNRILTKVILATLFCTLISSTAYLLFSKNIWREISESQAQKQSLQMPSWAPLVEKAQPAIVVIRTEAVVEQPNLELPGLPGPFRYFIPLPPEHQQGQGSGFIINEDGYMLTNEHVIAHAQKIKVTVGHNPQEFEAEVIGADKFLDIALLKIKTKEKIKWSYLPLGDSDKIKPGQRFVTVGSPLGLNQSVIEGILSAIRRGDIRPNGRDLFVELIQFGMAMNPGNSGGPILNDSGEVVAICEAIMASGQNISFGLPININKEILPQLLATGRVIRAYLGVEPGDLTPQYSRELGLSPNQRGAIVKQVFANTPAEKAGLKPMDVILEIEGKDVPDAFNLRQQTAYKGIGNTINLKIFRKGDGIKTIKAKLEERPGETSQIISKPNRETISSIVIESVGLEVTDTAESVRAELGLSPAHSGAQVVSVRPGSGAAFAALMPGDVITKVDKFPIKSAKHLKNIIDRAEKEKTFMMLIRRGPAERFVPLEKS